MLTIHLCHRLLLRVFCPQQQGAARQSNGFRLWLLWILLAAGFELAQAATVNPPGAVYFKTTTYATHQGGSVAITVVRGDVQNEASIHYATVDGSAMSDVDYTPTSGDLNFAVGQSSAYFWVSTLASNNADDGAKTVLLSLSNPSANADLGTPANAVLTIHGRHVDMTQYFPLAQGSEWQYLANGLYPFSCQIPFSFLVVNHAKTQSLICQGDGSKQNYSNDAQGIRLHRIFYPKLQIPRLGARKATLIANPPIVMSEANALIGQSFYTDGEFRASIAGLGIASIPFSATHTVQGYDTITLPAGSFEVIVVEGSISIGGQSPLVQVYYLAQGIGIVRQDTPNSTPPVSAELVSSNATVHDLALTKIAVPLKVALSAGKPSVSKIIKVSLQNRGPLSETISDAEALRRMLLLNIESLGDCPMPVPTMQTTAVQKRMPITLKPKQSLTVNFALTFDCANDLLANTVASSGHEDFRYGATVDYSALNGSADVHKADDSCPHSVKPPYMLDENPDGKVKDYGCGAKKPDKTLGAAIITDVTGP